MNLFVFGWPSNLGGASTKILHTALLLAGIYRVTIVAGSRAELGDDRWRGFLESKGIRCTVLDDLPDRLVGWGLAMCQPGFFVGGTVGAARRRGLKIAWSNDMMVHLPGELGALMLGLVDVIVYVSDIQRSVLSRGYAAALGCPPETADTGSIEGRIGSDGPRWVTTGNYIDPDWFPFRNRSGEEKREASRGMVVGRLSRADPGKFPDRFPESYESLRLREPRFRVMAWSEELTRRWSSFRFGPNWELLPALAESQVDFLHSLDLFVYQTGPRFRESWGRAVVEAALTGVVPLVPKGGGHHLENLVEHAVSGFHCVDDSDYGVYARLLQGDPGLRARMSRAAREWSAATLCDRRRHVELWQKVFL